MKIAFVIISCFLANWVLSSISLGADALENWRPEACQYHGEFRQTRTLQALPKPLESSGRFLFDCKAGVIWQTESPITDIVVYTISNTHFRLTGDNQPKLLKGVVHSNMATMLQALMGGDTAYLEQGFVAKAKPESDGENGNILLLVPKSASVKRYLQQIKLAKYVGAMDITLTNSPTDATHIATSAVTIFEADGIEACLNSLGPESMACEGLYFPARLAETLQTER